MLDSKLKDQLKAYLRMLKSNVTIGLSINEDENSKKLKSFIEEYYTEKREIPRWQHCSFSPKGLANSDNLCSKR